MSADRTTELLNLMSAMARDVGAMRQEINARFDRNEADINDLRQEMNARFDRNEAEITALRADLNATRSEMGAMHGEMNTRFDKLEKEVKEIKRDMRVLRDDSFNNRKDIKDLDDRVEILEGSAT